MTLAERLQDDIQGYMAELEEAVDEGYSSDEIMLLRAFISTLKNIQGEFA